MEQIIRDLRFGIRQLLRTPVFTLVSALALGLGISSITTQISITNGLFFKGLPYKDPDNLINLDRINVENANFDRDVPILEFLEWKEQQDVFADLAGYYVGTVNLTLDNKIERYDGAFVSGNTFGMLGVEAILGRGIQPADDLPDSPEVAVLSHQVWERDFGMDPDIIGQTAVINGRVVTIVGIMPKGFAFPMNEQVWVPILKQQDLASIEWGSEQISLDVMGRLTPGVSMDEAKSTMTVISRNLEAAHPDILKGFRDVDMRPYADRIFNRETKTMVAVMLLITALILIIACANVANLLLARSMRRQKEFAIRAALGASRSRIVSQFLTESILLAVIGSILGVGHAYYNVHKINDARVTLNTPFWIDFSIDARVLACVTLITVLSGILAGLIPAIRSARLNEYEILKDDTRTSSSMRMGSFSKAVVVVQISVTAVILTLVVLFVKSVQNAMVMDYEYDPDSVMTARLGLFDDVYPDAESRANFINSLLARLEARPDITYATTSHRHGFLTAPGVTYEMPGKVYMDKTERDFARFQRVSRNFFETVKLPVIAGRDFYPEEYDTQRSRHAIVNRIFAEREWPGQNPIGKQFKPVVEFPEDEKNPLPSFEVIGLVGDMNESGIFPQENDDGAAFYIAQTPASMPNFISILVRGNVQPADLIPILREEVATLDKNLPLYSVGTPRELVDKESAIFHFFLSVFREFGILATFLAAVGIYGVISFSVNQRIMEFGIRQALGATQAAVFKLVYRHAFKQLGLGFLIALALISPLLLSSGIKESMALFFYEIDENSLLPYFFSFGFVTAIAVIAAAPPAIRAAKIQPAQALRYE